MATSITELLDSDATVDVIAGALLEQLAAEDPALGRLGGTHISNLAASIAGESSGGAPSARMLRILEAFQWLKNRDMLAASTQPGMVFVTAKGREIRTAGGLKSYLESQSAMDFATDLAARELSEMKQLAENQVAGLKSQAEADIARAIEDAKKEAGEILNLARKTAEGVSLKDVQKQFADAGEECLKRIRAWTVLSCGCVAAFICVLVGFMTRWTPSLQVVANGPGVANAAYATAIYQAVIRVTLLTAIGAVATFCFRVLRAQMHLREQNLHRERVANSVAAFMGAASPEQRDAILIRIVDAITAFGNSGLLTDNDESMSPAKLILESIPRVASTKP